MRKIMPALAVALALAGPAWAADVKSGSVRLGPSDLTQQGRLSRNGLQQDWVNDEPFPGVVNPGTSYAYTTRAITFAPNALQDVYYDITFDDEATDLFVSAYLNGYDPTDLAANWLGDAGTSGNYFPGDPLFFDVVVPAGNSLVLVVNSTTGTGLSSKANYFIQAFSDTMYGEDFAAAVPEPATWTMMIAGFGLVGGALRRRVVLRVGHAA